MLCNWTLRNCHAAQMNIVSERWMINAFGRACCLWMWLKNGVQEWSIRGLKGPLWAKWTLVKLKLSYNWTCKNEHNLGGEYRNVLCIKMTVIAINVTLIISSHKVMDFTPQCAVSSLLFLLSSFKVRKIIIFHIVWHCHMLYNVSACSCFLLIVWCLQCEIFFPHSAAWQTWNLWEIYKNFK